MPDIYHLILCWNSGNVFISDFTIRIALELSDVTFHLYRVLEKVAHIKLKRCYNFYCIYYNYISYR
jgi:hypothetical protein